MRSEKDGIGLLAKLECFYRFDRVFFIMETKGLNRKCSPLSIRRVNVTV